MVIKPYGYAIWEKCRQSWIECLKKQVIKTPISLFVPKSMFEAEEKNAEGFAKRMCDYALQIEK
jgi:prolyl-tRNA synthetase